MRKLFLMLALISFTTIAACGGGEEGGGTPIPEPEPEASQPAVATLKLAVSGTLPAGASIGGIDVTVALASGVTAASTTAPATDSGVVVASGRAGSDAAILGTFTAAAGPAPATVRVLLADANGFAPGEFAIINCAIAAGSSPAAEDFTIQASEVKDLNGAVVSGITAELTVMFQ